MSKDYGVIKQRANNINYKEYQVLKELSFASKNLYNKAMYIKRQNFFNIKAIKGSINRSKLPNKTKKNLLKRKERLHLIYHQF